MINYSENEKNFFKQLLLDFEIRTDGREKIAIREYQITKNFLPSCYSSLKLSFQDGGKEILFAIKGEIINQYNPQIHKLLNISLDSMYRIDDIKIKKEIENHLEVLILDKINVENFRIKKDIQDYYWKIYIDVYIFDVIKLSLLQMLAIGLKEVLKNIKFPKIALFRNEITGEVGFDIAEQYEDISEREKEERISPEMEIPDVYIFAILNNSIFLDPTEEEFSIANSIVILSKEKEKIGNIQSIGSNVEIGKVFELTALISSF